MRGSDGFWDRSKRPAVTLLCFGRTDHDLRDMLLQSLQVFFESLKDDLPVLPECSCRFEPDPATLPAVNQDRAFYPVLERAGGNIVLGVTGTGFYDPSLSRFIFGYGRPDGIGILSTYRFRTETPGRNLYLERLGKQIIKTLAMACTMTTCQDEGCVVSYHRHVDDLDHNHYVCGQCREEFIRELSFFLNVPDDTPASKLLPDGE